MVQCGVMAVKADILIAFFMEPSWLGILSHQMTLTDKEASALMNKGWLIVDGHLF